MEKKAEKQIKDAVKMNDSDKRAVAEANTALEELNKMGKDAAPMSDEAKKAAALVKKA